MTDKCQKCIDKPKSRGMCRTHYERFRKARNPVCTADGCNKQQSYLKAGLCLAHFQKTPLGTSQKLKAVYGITVDEFNQMLENQNFVCAICGNPESKDQRLSVDHDHETKEVRGLLCFACNAGIGFLQDSSIILDKARQYLFEKGK